MTIYENECVLCGLPCVDGCRYKSVPHYYCDLCGDEEILYEIDGKELCLSCIERYLHKVNE